MPNQKYLTFLKIYLTKQFHKSSGWKKLNDIKQFNNMADFQTSSNNTPKKTKTE